MKQKHLVIIASVWVVCGIAVLLAGCGGKNNTDTATGAQITTVQRGNISIAVTGTGNLVLKNKQELSFGQTGLVSQATYAKISEVNVVAGQTVKKGQALVIADKTDWEDQLVIDQHNLYSAQADVATAQANVAQAQANIEQAQQNLIMDQQNLVTAQQNLNAQEDIHEIQTKIDNANIQLQQARMMLKAALNNDDIEAEYWKDRITYLSEDTRANSTGTTKIPDGGLIGVLQKNMESLLEDPASAGATLETDATSATEIQKFTLAVQLAQQQITTDQANMVTAQAALITAQNSVMIAKNKVEDSRHTLTQDQNNAQEILAPFDGLITQVNVSTGNIVERSAFLIEIADPNQFEAEIMVTERDVVSLSAGLDSSVTFNALPGFTFTARVTSIAPLGTIQEGVVNYRVTVELTPTDSAANTNQAGTNTNSLTLKEGFAAVVEIPIQQKNNILIVPSKAISHEGQNYLVQVENGGILENRIVKIGITDYQNTEIIEGLNQDERVVLPVISTAASSNSGGLFGGY